jgi:aryl-alcohol dehydrogenase-like predicted oxidoreductase
MVESLWVSEHYHLAKYDSLQPHYHLLLRREFESELADVCRAYGVGVISYSPLAGGFLTGKYRRGQTDTGSQRNVSRYFTDKNWDLLDLMENIAKARSKSISQIALGWLLSQPIVTCPIIGPRSLEQLQDNLGAAGFRLEPDENNQLSLATAWQTIQS